MSHPLLTTHVARQIGAMGIPDDTAAGIADIIATASMPIARAIVAATREHAAGRQPADKTN